MTLSNNKDELKPAGDSRRRYKPVNVIKGFNSDYVGFAGMTFEKKVHFCVSGFAPTMYEDDVKGFVSKIAKNVHDVSLVTNIYKNYNSFKNFKVIHTNS